MNLPASVQEIADVIGRERALFLVGRLPRCYAGKSGHKSTRVILYVPKTLKPNHRLVQILGWNDAKRLVDFFGGEILQPGNCHDVYARFRDRSIMRMLGEGMRPAAIADLMGVSHEHVRKIARQIPQEDMTAANDNTSAYFKRAEAC